MSSARIHIESPIHFVGIGGIGMSGIARLFLHRGFSVSGSDAKGSRIIDELKKSGARVTIGHRAGNIKGAGALVYSTAIAGDNPELVAARKKKIPCLRRAEALAALMQDKTVITVTGSHGKTTTTSLVSYLLLEAGFSPTVAIGGILKNIATNACVGSGELFIAEADESDGSFLCYEPHYSIVTNIDREHLDYYGSLTKEIDAFKKFIHQTKPEGVVFASADDERLMKILNGYKNRFVLYGFADNAQVYPRNISMDGLSSAFDCYSSAQFIARFHLALGGMHNISNALAVVALGLELKIGPEIIEKALRTYKGAGRRIEVKFRNDKYRLIDDYAHHPTEIKATLEAVRALKPRRLVVVFQPHRYTRTKLLLRKFGECFSLADLIIVTDIYPASEQPIPGISGNSVARQITRQAAGKEVCFLPKTEIIDYVLQTARPGDTIVTLGAGDITRICDELVGRFARQV
jgi:UDP-N-acetylmuramate--alanine ligase